MKKLFKKNYSISTIFYKILLTITMMKKLLVTTVKKTNFKINKKISKTKIINNVRRDLMSDFAVEANQITGA